MLKYEVRIKIAPIIGFNFFLVGLNVISLSSVIYGAKKVIVGHTMYLLRTNKWK